MSKRKTTDSYSAPPKNLEAEQSVLGAIFLDPENAIPAIFNTGMTTDDFYRESHRQIMRALLQLVEARVAIDAVTATTALREAGVLEQIGGPAYIAELVSFVPTAANVGHYAKIVRDYSRRRAVQEIGNNITQNDDDLDEVIGRARDQLAEIAARGQDKPSRWDRKQARWNPKEFAGCGPDTSRADASRIWKAIQMKGRVWQLATLRRESPPETFCPTVRHPILARSYS